MFQPVTQRAWEPIRPPYLEPLSKTALDLAALELRPEFARQAGLCTAALSASAPLLPHMARSRCLLICRDDAVRVGILAFYRAGDVRWEVVPAVLIAGRVGAGLYLAAGRPLRIGRGDWLTGPAWHVGPGAGHRAAGVRR